MDLQCTRCGAPLSMPADYAVWLVHCQYCGFEHELPDRAGRQAFAERRQQEAARAAQAAAQAVAAQNMSKKVAGFTRTLALLFIALPVVILLGAIGLIAYLSAQSGSAAIKTLSAAPKQQPPPALKALASAAEAGGCARVIDEPTLQNNEFSSTFRMAKAECLRILATSATPASLTLLVTDPAGVVTRRFGTNGSLDTTFCAKADAEHQVKLRGSPEFWVEALGCPRVFGTDPDTTGKAKVGARLKQLMAHGCYQVSFAASTFLDDRKFTTPLDPGTCFDVIAATGVPDNELKVTLSSPFGEPIVPLAPPATDIEVPYCAASSGPHVTEISGAVNGPFSVAIAICTRKALPQTLPKAAK